MTTLETIKDTIQRDIDRELKGLAYFNKLVEVFKPFEGKKITKRMETAVKTIFPDRVVYLDKSFGMFHLQIWGGDIKMEKRLSFLIGHDSDPIYHEGDAGKDYSGFRYYSICYGAAAIERNEKRRIFLKDTKQIKKLAKVFNDYKKALKELEDYDNYDLPSWYAIQKALKVTL